MNIKKLSVIGILAFSTISALNVSYASETSSLCSSMGIFAKEAMASRQRGNSMKEIKKDMDRLLQILAKHTDDKNVLKLFKNFSSIYTVEVSKIKIEKNKKKKRKIIEDYRNIKENMCNTTVKEFFK